jgi:hypothetical protein
MGEVQQEQQHAKDDDGDEMKSKSVDVSASASTLGKDHLNRPLTRREILNLTFALLAWACTICNVTLSTYRS